MVEFESRIGFRRGGHVTKPFVRKNGNVVRGFVVRPHIVPPYICRSIRTRRFCPDCHGQKGGCETCKFTGKVPYKMEDSSNEDTPNE